MRLLDVAAEVLPTSEFTPLRLALRTVRTAADETALAERITAAMLNEIHLQETACADAYDAYAEREGL